MFVVGILLVDNQTFSICKQLERGEPTVPPEPESGLISEIVACFGVIALNVIHSFVNRLAIPVLWALFTLVANVMSNDGRLDTSNHTDLT